MGGRIDWKAETREEKIILAVFFAFIGILFLKTKKA
jgi:hypothetical protein